MRFAIDRQVCILSAIASLLWRSRPPYISRLVVAVIVRIAVNAVIWRGAWANMGKEGLEGVAPFIANGDAATAIVFITTGFRI